MPFAIPCTLIRRCRTSADMAHLYFPTTRHYPAQGSALRIRVQQDLARKAGIAIPDDVIRSAATSRVRPLKSIHGNSSPQTMIRAAKNADRVALRYENKYPKACLSIHSCAGSLGEKAVNLKCNLQPTRRKDRIISHKLWPGLRIKTGHTSSEVPSYTTDQHATILHTPGGLQTFEWISFSEVRL